MQKRGAPRRDEEAASGASDLLPRATKAVYAAPMWLKGAVLLALLCQNTTYTLVRRYSMAVLKEKYDAGDVLLMGEAFKLFFAVGMTLSDTAPSDAMTDGGSGLAAAVKKLSYLVRASGKMFGLAVIYGIMNVLSYVSIRRVDAAVFAVCAQLKILTTAAFSVILLRKQLTPTKWRSLLQLVLGCVLVTVPQIGFVASSSRPDASSEDPTLDAAPEFDSGAFIVGVSAVLIEVIMSGFASIYFEKVVKTAEEKLTVWDRNFQLALHSIVLYCAYTSWERAYFPEENQTAYQPLHDFSLVAWVLVILGGGGGLLVAMTVKVADSVLKTLATSISIVTSTLASHYILGGPLNLPMAMGSLIVALAVLNYTLDATPAPAPAPAS